MFSFISKGLRKYSAALACLLFFSTAGGAQNAGTLRQVRNVYVGSLGGKSGAERMREEISARLRKNGQIALVASPDQADAVITGSGELWIKGYFSLNPRAHGAENGQPVYGGFLSVELKGGQNETLWSYLVTPRRNDTGDTARDLAARAVKKLLEAVVAERSK